NKFEDHNSIFSNSFPSQNSLHKLDGIPCDLSQSEKLNYCLLNQEENFYSHKNTDNAWFDCMDLENSLEMKNYKEVDEEYFMEKMK
ncbi:MAG: hypothetical protein MHPSP_003890, partial [Paramarteilia canceri]